MKFYIFYEIYSKDKKRLKNSLSKIFDFPELKTKEDVLKNKYQVKAELEKHLIKNSFYIPQAHKLLITDFYF